jgi:hypothetical protein
VRSALLLAACWCLVGCRGESGARPATLADLEAALAQALLEADPARRLEVLASLASEARRWDDGSEPRLALRVIILRPLAQTLRQMGDGAAAGVADSERAGVVERVLAGHPAAGWAYAERARDLMEREDFAGAFELLDAAGSRPGTREADERHFVEIGRTLAAHAMSRGDEDLEMRVHRRVLDLIGTYLERTEARKGTGERAWRVELLARGARVAFRLGERDRAWAHLRALEALVPADPETVELRKLFADSPPR